MLDQERGSIIRFFQSVNSVQIYLERIPEDMIIPSMYFPTPLTDGARDSLSSYMNDYQMFIKVFEISTPLAFVKAEKIMEAVKKNRNLIEIYNQDGTTTNHFLRIDKMRSREIETGVYQIEINWKSRRELQRAETAKMAKVNFDMKLGGAN